MSGITIYTKKHCSYCVQAKVLLQSKEYLFHEISLEAHPELLLEVMERSGQRTVPQIFVGNQSVGGFTELFQKISNGEFDALIQPST